MHIKYPRKKDFFTWEELGCLSKALGFQKTLFYKNIPPEINKENLTGLEIKTISELLDMKTLHGDLHRTYNMHDALYNGQVIKKAADMLSNRYLSFQELREVRVAFQLYEHEDMLGLITDEQILLRTLKVCGRSVSPVKLMQHIKHMEKHVANRLMLYEFMDLLLLCERDAEIEIQSLPPVSGLDRNKLYKICDFKSVLVTNDERKINQLNATYEQGLFRSHVSNKTQPHTTWRAEQNFIVDAQPRIEQVSRQQQRSVQLADHLNHSNKKVQHARCGHMGAGITRSFIDLNDVDRQGKRSTKHRVAMFDSPLLSGPLTPDEGEREGIRVNFVSSPPREFCITPELSPPSTTESQFYTKHYQGTTSEKLSRMSRDEQRQILVSPRDVHNANVRIKNLNWDIETQSVRIKRKVDKQMREKYPQYYRNPRQRHRPSVQGVDRTTKTGLSLRKQTTEDGGQMEDPSTFEVQISPRRYVPKRDNIYSTLKSRLQKTDTLLDYGGVEVPVSSPFSLSLTKQLESRRGRREHEPQNGPRSLTIENLGSLPGRDDLKSEVDREDTVILELLEKFQEASYVASGRKKFGGKPEWKQSMEA